MTLFEHNYNGLVAYAGAVIERQGLNIEAEDLVSEAYIIFVESKKEYDRNEFKKLISSAAYNELKKSQPKEHNSFNEQICCNKCHELKPANAFYSGRMVCKQCIISRVIERRKGIPQKSYYKYKPIPLALRKKNGRKRKYKYSDKKEMQKVHTKAWLSKEGNREKWNAYMREKNKIYRAKKAA